MVMYNEPSHEMLQTFANQYVISCQTALVEKLLENGTFEIEEVENLYHSKEEMLEQGYSEEESEDPTPQEIYEWWLVDNWLAEQLEKHNEPLIKNDYGTWWGRTCTGQSVALDSVIKTIFVELMNS